MDVKKMMMWPHKVIMRLQCFDFLAPLALRIYLVPIFWVAGMNKFADINAVAQWFGHDLGLPIPLFFAYMAAITEVVGAVCLALGLGLRAMVLPLIAVMFVAIFTVHLDNGWGAIANEMQQASQRLGNILSWLQEHYPKRFQYATELGRPVILNNGIEFAVTYIIMLFTLFFTGAGKYLSVDYWLGRYFCSKGKSCD